MNIQTNWKCSCPDCGKLLLGKVKCDECEDEKDFLNSLSEECIGSAKLFDDAKPGTGSIPFTLIMGSKGW